MMRLLRHERARRKQVYVLVGNEPIRVVGIMRVKPQLPTDRFVYSLEVKRDYQRQVSYECPPALDPACLTAIEQAAKTVYRALGCRDVSRVDFRMRQGIPYFLEVNPLPGLNPRDSDLVIMARLAGWSYEQLVTAIFEAALVRQQATAALTPRK